MEQQLTWVAVAALAIGAIVRALKSDSPLPEWLHVPKEWRPVLATGLGIVSGVLDSVVNGTPWLSAIGLGIASAIGAMLGHQVVIEKARDGKELPIPFARKPSDTAEPAPPDVPPATSDESDEPESAKPTEDATPAGDPEDGSSDGDDGDPVITAEPDPEPSPSEELDDNGGMGKDVIKDDAPDIPRGDAA